MSLYVSDPDFQLHVGDVRDVLKTLPDESVHCVVTSPPYWGLRDYGTEGQLGLEPTPEEYVANMVEVFREVRRALRADGTCWLNLGDSYVGAPVGSFNGGGFKDKSAQTGGRDLSGVETSGQLDKTKATGLKPKDLVGIPWRVAFALQADGWYLRSDIIWAKPNPMPESVTDRPTKAHEYIFLLTKSPRYFFDQEAVRGPSTSPEQEAHNQRYAKVYDAHSENVGNGAKQPGNVGSLGIHSRPGPGGRNIRSVWEIATEPYPQAHFATFPQALVEPCIKAGCPEGGTCLDPFGGSGTTALVARRLGRRSVLIELNPAYAALAAERLSQLSLLAESGAGSHPAPNAETPSPPVKEKELSA